MSIYLTLLLNKQHNISEISLLIQYFLEISFFYTVNYILKNQNETNDILIYKSTIRSMLIVPERKKFRFSSEKKQMFYFKTLTKEIN